MDYVDIEVNLGEKLAKQIWSMKKTELIECLVASALKEKVDREDILRLENENRRLKSENKKVYERLDKCESYVEQARGMINSVTEQWYHYD
jgi:uncharacterized protein (UPF0335 family)